VIRIYAAIALFAAIVAGGWYMRHEAFQRGYESAERTLTAQYNAKLMQAQAEAREAETRMAANANAAAIAYEKGKQDAQATADRVVADLQRGTLRLRREWQQCAARSVSQAATPASQPDAAPDGIERRASRIVRAADTCAEQVKGLQDYIRGITQ
jgi:hypothetical protein